MFLEARQEFEMLIAYPKVKETISFMIVISLQPDVVEFRY